MYYYGARYGVHTESRSNPRISIFVSVDPMAEKYPGWTPYHYVHNNPVNMIDPTGMSAENPGDPPKKRSKWSFAKIKSDLNKAYNSTGIRGGVEWFKNNDFANGVGGYIFSGIGGLNFGGWLDIKGKPKVIKVGDMASPNAGGTTLRGSSLVTRTADGIQSVNTTISTGVSIKEDLEKYSSDEQKSVQMKAYNVDSIDVSDKRVYASEKLINLSGTASEVEKKQDSLKERNAHQRNEREQWIKTLEE